MVASDDLVESGYGKEAPASLGSKEPRKGGRSYTEGIFCRAGQTDQGSLKC